MKFGVWIVFSMLLGQMSAAKMVFQKETEKSRLIVVADDFGKNQMAISDPQKDTYHPSISTSGRYVAYSEGIIQPPDTQMQVVVQDLTRNIKEVWSPIGNQNIHVEFSGNEKYLAYSGPNPQTGKQNIHIINLLTERLKGPTATDVESLDAINKPVFIYSPSTEIIKSPYDCYAPAVSSDGSMVVYHRTSDKNDKKAPKQLVAYNVLTKQEFELTDADKHAMFPSFSSDDRYLAYVSQDGGQWDIYVFDLWTKTAKPVTNDSEIEFTPYFKNNNEIYFTRFTPAHPEAEDQSFGIDIYFLPELDLGSSRFVTPKVFLNDVNAAEYVPSFSSSADLSQTKLPDFPKPERSSFGAVTHYNKIFIAGGHQGPEHSYPKESFLNLFQSYDLNSKIWETLAPMPEAKHGFQMAAYNNYIYVFGGFTFSDQHLPKWKSVDTVERYNISTGTWQTLPVKLPRARSSNGLALVGDKAYLIGGWDSTPKFAEDRSGRFHPEIDVFDFSTNTFTTLEAPMPAPLRRALTAVTHNHQIYLLGGIGEGASHFDWISNVTVFDTKTNLWEEKKPLPFATFAPGAGVIYDQILLFGGMILRDLKTFDIDYVDDIYSFSVKSNTWEHTGLFLRENKGFPQVVPFDFAGQGISELGILGGHTYIYSETGVEDHPVSTFETFKIESE